MTPQQRTALSFIATYTKMHGVAPSYDEIGVGLAIPASSRKSSVHRLVMALLDQGRITMGPGRNRNLEVVPQVTVEEIAEEIAELATGGGADRAGAFGVNSAARSVLSRLLPNLPRSK